MKIRYNKTILILYGVQTECFTDLKKFCEIKEVCYNSWKQKKFPMIFEGHKLVKQPKGVTFEYVEINGELIEIL